MARILKCPPSATLSAGLPEVTNAKADEGTRVHAVIERTLRTGELPPPLAPFVKPGKNMPDRDVAGYVQSFVHQLGAGQLLIEQRAHLAKGCWGTLDIAHLADIITVFDYKNGAWDVEARGNPQMLTYAATFLDAYPNVQHFRLVIFQPNSWANGSNPNQDDGFKQHIHTRAEVEAHRAAVLAAIAYQGPPKPGPHCRWCPAFSRCPAMSQDANFLMAVISRDPGTLTADELTRMLRIIRSVSDMKELLENRLTELLKMGASVAGVELKPSRKWAAWNDERHAAEYLWSKYGARGVKPIGVAAAKKLGSDGAQYASIGSHKPEPELKASY
jgi:hypothetical protein